MKNAITIIFLFAVLKTYSQRSDQKLSRNSVVG